MPAMFFILWSVTYSQPANARFVPGIRELGGEWLEQSENDNDAKNQRFQRL